MLTLEQQKDLQNQPNPVLVAFEKDMSPRCRDTITYMDNHKGGLLKPTRKPTNKHTDQVTDQEKAELVKFDMNFAERVRNTPPELRISSNL